MRLVFTLIISGLLSIYVNAQTGGGTVTQACFAGITGIDTITKIFTFVEVMPKFSGGNDSLMKFLAANINYGSLNLPRGFKGRLLTRIVVSPEGNIVKSEIVRSVLTLN